MGPNLNAKHISISYGFEYMPRVALYDNENIAVFSVQRADQIWNFPIVVSKILYFGAFKNSDF